jgi:hypothetical protein
MQVYKRAGFNVRTILMDEEFEKIKDLMPQVCYKPPNHGIGGILIPPKNGATR